MPKVAKELSALEVSRIATPGLWAVGKVSGLHLQVGKSGSRSWILRVIVGDRRRDIGLGAYPAITLADAHRKAREAKEQIANGVDPVERARAAASALRAAQAKAMTFKDAALACIAAKEGGWRNAKHAAQWRTTLETYTYPKLGSMLVQHIERAHVLEVLEPIWRTKSETASRVRSRIEIVLDYAAQKLDLQSFLNPARYRNNLDKVLPKKAQRKPKHHAAVKIDDAPGFFQALNKMQGIAPRALELVALTATRTSEVLGAKWSEIDIDAARWSIPAERMKANVPHVVPLSKAAVAVLRAVPRIDDSEYVFPSADGGSLSINALRAVMQRMGLKEVPHGLRSTFRDWAAERSHASHEVAEMALAHAIPDKTVSAYLRSDLFTKRAVLMQTWADFLTAEPATSAKVFSFPQNAAA